MKDGHFTEMERRMLQFAHPDLRKVIYFAVGEMRAEFCIVETARDIYRQGQLYQSGATTTMNSRHIVDDTGFCYAIDIAPQIDNQPSWAWPHYYPLADKIKDAAQEVKVPIEWGGDWMYFKDGPHWQLPIEKYPPQYGKIA